MEKKINIIAEELMKVLISLDGLTFTETQKDARAKRLEIYFYYILYYYLI